MTKYGEICATLNTLSCMGRLTSILNTTKDKKLNGATYVQFRYHQGLKAEQAEHFWLCVFSSNFSEWSLVAQPVSIISRNFTVLSLDKKNHQT